MSMFEGSCVITNDENRINASAYQSITVHFSSLKELMSADLRNSCNTDLHFRSIEANSSQTVKIRLCILKTGRSNSISMVPLCHTLTLLYTVPHLLQTVNEASALRDPRSSARKRCWPMQTSFLFTS